ncbi:hypothetical protein [Azohydromonas aeria]|uniref:hypothetical protein n=1 Tax=Azohydromonas aeria TaxID=2590212 RepID=UPI0012F8BCD2|nr:hypothetical protein [Azohydromonas aeria]
MEREADRLKFAGRVGLRAVKPRCVLICGRSQGWTSQRIKTFPSLDACFHKLVVMTHNPVLKRGRRMLEVAGRG